MILVQISDFTGRKELAKSGKTNPVLQDFIDDFEADYICKILGVELGELLIADVQAESGSDPLEDRFTALIEPFRIQSTCGKIYKSLGLKDILTSLIYYNYVPDRQVRQSQSGATTGSSETSTVLSPRAAMRSAEAVHNAALDSIEAIQWRCYEHGPDIYPEYDGQKFDVQYSSLIG